LPRLDKPFRREELAALIERLIEQPQPVKVASATAALQPEEPTGVGSQRMSGLRAAS
jgi:hypothetical protein